MTKGLANASFVTEKDWQSQVTDALKLFGWRWVHFRTSIGYKRRYQTAQDGDKGWVDIVAVRRGRMLLIELKSASGRLTDDQKAWRDELKEVAGVGYYMWRPSDSDVMMAVLR